MIRFVLFIAIIICLAPGRFVLASESMYVFFPSTTRAKVMQEKIATQCPDISVVVFGRQRDFAKQLVAEPPHFLLTPALVANSVSEYTTALNATRSNKEDQAYYLASINVSIPLNKLSGKRVGAVGLLDARSMSDFLAKELKSKIRVKRVTKVEDLLPLITFNSVDAIFVSEADLAFLKSKTELSLATQDLTTRLGIATLAEKQDMASSKLGVSCVSNFGEELNGMFGVQQWK